MGIEDVAELLSHLMERSAGHPVRRQFRQPVAHDAAHELGRMREKLGQMLGVLGLGRVGLGQAFQKVEGGSRIVGVDQPVGRRLVSIGVKRGLWN